MQFVLDAPKEMASIEGIISELASRTTRPSGYPFSKVSVYAVNYEEIKPFEKYINAYFLEIKPITGLPYMKKLDFKKAGKVFGNAVQQMKDNLSEVPEEYLITAERFDVVDEQLRKTTGCRKYLIECEIDEVPELWEVILFRKEIKKYITETLNINIVPPIFGDKYPEENPTYCCPRVVVTLGSCKEYLYQALEEYGKQEFASYPIRVHIPTRIQICGMDTKHSINYNGNTVAFNVRVSA